MIRHTSLALASALVLSTACFSFGCGAGDPTSSPSSSSSSANGTHDSAEMPASGAGGNSVQNTTNDPQKAALPTGNAGSAAPPSSSTPTTTTTTAPTTITSPPPTAACTVSKDQDGFFWRTSSASDYAAFVPASYSAAKPTTLIVGLHGCGDDAMNFAKWGINPWDTRSAQNHIGISISGETGAGACWNKGVDDAKIFAAIDDIASCFWIDRSRIILAGFSSGGELGYRVALMHADTFAGLLIENSGLSEAGTPEATLLGDAAWKINIAHRAHMQDATFPIAQVQADWSTIENAGFPITTSEVPGTHDGDGDDWASWLIPQAATWVHP